MLKDHIKWAIREFHETPIPPLVERKVGPILPLLAQPVHKVTTIIGPRRAGKTFFLYQIIQRLIQQGVRMEDILYLNFEDERILPITGSEMQVILDAYFELYPEKTSPFIFLDEIQNVPDWDRFVRRMNDAGRPIFITGSNSRLLAHDIATSLRGRTLAYEIFPFSFPEFLEAKGVHPTRDTLYGNMRHRVKELYGLYLRSGGYPEIAFIEEATTKQRILQDYFNSVFYRDLVDRYNIQHTDLLRQWLNALVMNISSLVSFSKIENDFKSRGIKVSRSTLSYFARYVEDAFFGFFLEMHSESLRKRQINPRKFYIVDVGLHNYLSFRSAGNRGRILENLVFLHLRRKDLPLFYYKTRGGQEIDFLVLQEGRPRLIQVCDDLTHIATASREMKALETAMKELDVQRSILVTSEEKRVESSGGRTIHILPAWEWLLGLEAEN